VTVTDRAPHWIKTSNQERIPPRMVAFDTESRSSRSGDIETQTWRTGCAIRWRNDLKTGQHAEGRVFASPDRLWEWVDEFTKPETRTVVWAHNLSHDVRISCVMTVLPALGYTLEWCNLDQSVSAMVWRSDHGTIVLADTWTWVPLPLSALAEGVGLVKFDTPNQHASEDSWDVYCMRDAHIVFRIISDLVDFIRREHCGNWQPTGAGMAYSFWRHQFLRDKILVHDDQGALEAEHAAMHAGRAEAWRHGKITGPLWTEVDMRNAYLTIGAECELPRKLQFHCGAITSYQYRRLASIYRVLCRCVVHTSVPTVPYDDGNKTYWPIGTFETWLWDTEVNCALRYGGQVTIREAYTYAKSPVLAPWAGYLLPVLQTESVEVSPIVKTWLKQASRSLIGRLALQSRSWEYYGTNPESLTGISHMTDSETNQTRRMMHTGDQTFIESDMAESKDSVPMITGAIMAECRVRLWEAMYAAGLAEVAHVDTDSLLVSAGGLEALQAVYGAEFGRLWQVKGSWRTIDVIGPRHYYRGRERVISGVPLAASETAPGLFAGERWASIATDLETRGDGVVTTSAATWTPRRKDPRRDDAAGTDGFTRPYVVGAVSSSSMSEAPIDTGGE
jgi:hypothetical protein